MKSGLDLQFWFGHFVGLKCMHDEKSKLDDELGIKIMLIEAKACRNPLLIWRISEGLGEV